MHGGSGDRSARRSSSFDSSFPIDFVVERRAQIEIAGDEGRVQSRLMMVDSLLSFRCWSPRSLFDFRRTIADIDLSSL